MNKVRGKKAGKKFIIDNGWATKAELNSFDTTVEHHRHWKEPKLPMQMDLIDARRLVGRIIAKVDHLMFIGARRELAEGRSKGREAERHLPTAGLSVRRRSATCKR